MGARRVAIVPHTHWDREWYEPFQAFRLKLVELLDSLLPQLESDPSYPRYLLDGQMAVVDDYLEVRPEAESSIRRLAASGRVSMGPWYVLMDEFLVSGETLVRNLQMGLERAATFGGAMQVGYLPDMFGHIAQMPQLLSQAGFDHAVVWRGVPLAIDRTAFDWSAPDGSTVRAEYLVCGYGNGAAVPDDAKALLRRIAAHEEEVRDFLLEGILFMNGTDHQWPQPWLGRVVAEANAVQDRYELVVTSLEEALRRAPAEGLKHWRGELRSGARANLLMGVASNRVDVKQAAARAERALERQAEPACALFLPAHSWPAALLGIAWRQSVLNSAHDSICACSLDEVVDAVLHRFAEARDIGDGLTRRALDSLRATLAAPGPTAVNLSARPRGGVVELLLEGHRVPEGTQQLRRSRSHLGGETDVALKVAEVRSVLGMMREQQIGPDLYVNAISAEEDSEGLRIVIHADTRPRGHIEVEEAKRELYARLGSDPEATVRVRFVQPPSTRVLARVEDVPGFGWKRCEPAPAHNPVEVRRSAAQGPIMSNGLVTVEVDPSDGSLSLDGTAGLNRLVDGGDNGDTYNYSPPEHDTVVADPLRVDVRVVESGPVRARVDVVRTYSWPERIDPASRSRAGAMEVPVTSRVELCANERLVRIETSFDNRCRDHRLRAVFPLPERAARSSAECAFAVVDRGLTAEGGPSERGVPTFPSRRFVSAGGLTVLHEGLLEYELVDLDREDSPRTAGSLALTLVRSTGMLSRIDMAYRPVPAGPPIRLEGPQLQRPIRCRYALAAGVIDPYAAADDAFLPLQIVEGAGGGDRPATGSALVVNGAEVSALGRRGSALEVRVFNPSSREALCDFGGLSGWKVDLRGRPQGSFEGALSLGPWQIATVLLAQP